RDRWSIGAKDPEPRWDLRRYTFRTPIREVLQMRKSIAGLLFAAAAVGATPSHAITGNYVKDTEHPFVGLVVFYDAAGQFIWRCSGSLISPTKFITAGHCADTTAGGAASARIYFQQDAGAHFEPATQHDPVSGYPDDCA